MKIIIHPLLVIGFLPFSILFVDYVRGFFAGLFGL